MRPGAVRFPWGLAGCGGVSVRYCGVRGVALCCPRRCVMRPGVCGSVPPGVMLVSVALCPGVMLVAFLPLA